MKFGHERSSLLGLVKRDGDGINVRSSLWTLRNLFLFTGLSGGIFSPYLSLLLAKDGLSSTSIGIVMAVGTLVTIIAQPFWGILVDKYQVVRLTLVLSTVVPGFLAAFYDSPTLWILLFATILSNVVMTPNVPVMNAYAVMAARESGSTFGWIRLFGSIGYAIAGYLGGMFVQHFSMQNLWFLFALFSLIGGVFAFRLPKATVGVAVSGSIRAGVGELLRSRRFLLFLAGTFLISQTLTAYTTYFVLAFQSIGGSVSESGIAFMLSSATNVPAMMLANRVSKRLGRGNTMLLSAIAYALRWAVQAAFPIPWVAIAVQALHGISFGFFYIAAVEYVAESTRVDLQNTGQSLFNMASGGIAGIVGNALNGYLLHVGGNAWMYGACAASAGLGAVCLFGSGLTTSLRMNKMVDKV